MKPDQARDFLSDTSLDHEIEAILSVAPSPDFVSRVRTHVERQAVPFWTMGWTSFAAGSVVVAVVVAVVIARAHEPYENVQPDAMAPVARSSVRLGTPPDDVPASPDLNSTKPPRRYKPEIAKATFREPRMMINPKEAAAIRHFLENPDMERVELSMVTIEPQPLPEFKFTSANRHLSANPDPGRVELSMVTMEPQPLPEFKFAAMPMFVPTAAPQGDFK